MISVTLKGTSPVRFYHAGESGTYGTVYRDATLTPLGKEFPINGYGYLAYFKMRHNVNADIDLDSIILKVIMPGDAQINNTTKGGA